jgi:Ser-tRNA(Ala) deacylase AlaX
VDDTDQGLGEGVSPIKVWLDQTLFYPEGGGQPYDTGLLRIEELGLALPVTKVLEEDNDIVHYVCCPLDKSDGLLSLIGKEGLWRD